MKSLTWGQEGGGCGAVTHIHESGERHKSGLASRGWGPPCPQWVQGPVSSVDSAKRDPVGRKILTARKLPFWRHYQTFPNRMAWQSKYLHGLCAITVITGNPTITSSQETLSNTMMINFPKTVQEQTIRNRLSPKPFNKGYSKEHKRSHSQGMDTHKVF